MTKLARLLWTRRDLVVELTRRDLFGGHGTHFLGGLWVFVTPLIMLGGYFLAFRLIFPSRLPAGGSAEMFLLAGLIQWIFISETIVRACSTLRTHLNLVKQINFPIEILFATTVAAGLFVQTVMTAGLLVIMLASQVAVGPQAIALWVLAMVIQTVFLFGVALCVGAITPFVPDVSEGVGMVARLGLFLTPILYQADSFGPTARALFHLNPFSYFAWIHQDALHAQALTYPWAWIGAAALAGSALVIGHTVFRALEHAFTDAL